MRGPWRSEVDRWTWTDWIWHRDVCGRWLQRAARGSSWTENDWGVYWLWGGSEGERQVFFWLDFGVWFLKVIFRDSYIATCTAGHRRRWSRRLLYSSSSPNCHLFAVSHLSLHICLKCWHISLRCCTINLKVARSNPAGVSGILIDIKSFRSHYGPGVDSASNRNDYQEYFLRVKAAGA